MTETTSPIWQNPVDSTQTTARDVEARCPKCKSRSFKVTYVDAHETANDVVDGRWTGVFEVASMPARTSAHGDCTQCKHAWRFRSGWVD